MPHEFPKNSPETFDKYNDLKLENCDWVELPPDTLHIFEMFDEKELKERPENLDLYKVSNGDGDVSYIVARKKTSYNFNKEIAERYFMFLIYDFGYMGFTGYTLVKTILETRDEKTFVIGDIGSLFPHTDMTFTEKKFRRENLALRRMKIANALSQMYFNTPLHISPDRTKYGKHFVAFLERTGLVRKSQTINGGLEVVSQSIDKKEI